MRRLATYGFHSQPVICLTKASHKTANVGRSAQMFTVWQWSFRKAEKNGNAHELLSKHRVVSAGVRDYHPGRNIEIICMQNPAI